MQIAAALRWANEALVASPSADVDAESLLCHVLSCQVSRLHAWPEQQLTAEQQQQFESLIQQRQAGKPVAYLTGTRGFWSLDLAVTDATLIPRPDTETLVECAIDKLSTQDIVVDLGTGSGAIACALLAVRPDVRVFAMDFSALALTVAQQNGQINKMSLWRGSWSQALASNSVNMIVSNPPYIEESDPHLQEGDLRFEPQTALVSGKDGLDALRLIIDDAPRCLKTGGWLMVEHGYDQAASVVQLFSEMGFRGVTGVQDLAGQDRVTYGQCNE